MMTGRTAPAAHHQKIVVTLIQTNLSHPLLEGAVPDTPPLATPLPENRERGFSSCELTACSNLAPYLYRARDKMGGQQLSPSPRPCNRLKVNQTTFLLLFFFSFNGAVLHVWLSHQFLLPLYRCVIKICVGRFVLFILT